MRAFGFDLGSHVVLNDPSEIDWDQLMAWDLAPEFVLIRSHLGLWTDPVLSAFAAEAERVGLWWGSWPVLRAGQSVSAQVRQWALTRPGPLGRWIDYETVKGLAMPSASQLLDALRGIEQADGRTCGIYSRYRLVDKYLGTMPEQELNERPWWLAQYLYPWLRREHPGPPTAPKRVDRRKILIHQTADRLGPPGSSIPHVKALDRNRWTGIINLAEFAGKQPEPTVTERVAVLEREANSRGWNLE